MKAPVTLLSVLVLACLAAPEITCAQSPPPLPPLPYSVNDLYNPELDEGFGHEHFPMEFMLSFDTLVEVDWRNFYTVQATQDFVTWVDLYGVEGDGHTYYYLESSALYSHRFYRLRTDRVPR